MSFCFCDIVTITTNANGVGSGYTQNITGKIATVIYTKVDYSDGVDFVISTEDTNQSIWGENNVNASKTIAPRQKTQDTRGSDLVYVDAKYVCDKIPVSCERIKISISSGGDTKSGMFKFIID